MVQQKSQSESTLMYNSQMQNPNIGYSSGYSKAAANKYNCGYQANQACPPANSAESFMHSVASSSSHNVPAASTSAGGTQNVPASIDSTSHNGASTVMGDHRVTHVDARASSAGPLPSTALSCPGQTGAVSDIRANSAGPTVTAQRPRDLTLSDLALNELSSVSGGVAEKSMPDTSTPTPTQFLFPKKVTEEQEDFSRGFARALAEIYQKEGVVPSVPNVLCSDLSVKQEEASDNSSTSRSSALISNNSSNTALSMQSQVTSAGLTAVKRDSYGQRQFSQQQAGQRPMMSNTGTGCNPNVNYNNGHQLPVPTQQFTGGYPVRNEMRIPGHGNLYNSGIPPHQSVIPSLGYNSQSPFSSSQSVPGTAMRYQYQQCAMTNSSSSQLRPAPSMQHYTPMGPDFKPILRYQSQPTHSAASWAEGEASQWMKQEPMLSPPMKTYTSMVPPSVKSEFIPESARGLSVSLPAAASPLLSSAASGSGSSCSSVALDLGDQERLKLERKRAKNRIAAQRCQMRKVEKISRLEDKVSKLHDQNANLSQTVAALNNHISELRRQINAHASRGCRLLLPNIAPPTGVMQ